MTVSYSKGRSGQGEYYAGIVEQSKTSDEAMADYYAEAKEPPGVWYVGLDANGKRASGLGIAHGKEFAGKDGAKRFQSLVNGFHPDSGSGLTQNAGSASRIALHDFTFSAPKSVSVVWSQAEEPLKSKIEAAVFAGGQAFLDEINNHCYTRAGKDGIVKEKASIQAALFRHGSSRENDPQLHVHCVAFNVAERANGKTSAIETESMFRWIGASATMAHVKLADDIRQLGFGIEKGLVFEIAGVPTEVNEAFSKRRNQIVKQAKLNLSKLIERNEQGQSNMTVAEAKLTRSLLQRATLETRNDKGELSRAELQERWIAEGEKLGFTANEVNALLVKAAIESKSIDSSVLVGDELTDEHLFDEARAAVDEITEMNSVFTEPALQVVIGKRLLGRASVDQVKRAIELVKERHLLISREKQANLGNFRLNQDEDRFTTKDMLVTELQMVTLANRKHGEHVLDFEAAGHLLPTTMAEEQLAAVERACTDQNAVTIVEGTAGAGKTFTMATVSRVYEAHGYQVVGLSAGWTQALNLQKEAQLQDGKSIARWVNDVRAGKIDVNERTLIVLDEAGMVGARDMRDVLDLAEMGGAKVILLGDTLQQKSVAAGDALRVLTDRFGSVRLDDIRRQRDAQQKAAVYKFFAGDSREGLQAYQDQNLVNIVDKGAEATHAKMVEDYMSARATRQDLGINQFLMVASTRDDVAALNRIAHYARQAAGELGESVSVYSMDAAEPEARVEFSVGDFVAFRANDKKQEVFNRQRGRIVDVHTPHRVDAETGELIPSQSLTIELEDGRQITVNSEDKKWHDEEGRLAIQHAYATTTYASQGMTVEYSFVKDHAALTRNAAGVAMSRHRTEAKLYIDKQYRYERAMEKRLSERGYEEGRPTLADYKNSDVMEDVATSWHRSSDKVSTLDYDNWRDLKDHRQVWAENEARLADLDLAQKASEIEAQRAIEHAKASAREWAQKNEVMAGLMVDPPESRHLPLYDIKAVELKSTEHDTGATEASRKALEEQRLAEFEREGIDPRAVRDAREQGFMEYDRASHDLVFVGKNHGTGAALNHVRETLGRDGLERYRAQETFRDMFPPVLAGDGKTRSVDVVSTGQQALHLRSLQYRTGQPLSTIVVSHENPATLRHENMRNLMRQADERGKLYRHDLDGAHARSIVHNDLAIQLNEQRKDLQRSADRTSEPVAVKFTPRPVLDRQDSPRQERQQHAEREQARLQNIDKTPRGQHSTRMEPKKANLQALAQQQAKAADQAKAQEAAQQQAQARAQAEAEAARKQQEEQKRGLSR